MESSKFNTSSPLRTNAENASPLRARLQAALDAYDKENAAGLSGTPPKSQIPRAFNRQSLPESMNTYINKSPFHAQNRLAVGLKAPLSIRGRLSDGGAIFNQGAGGLGNMFLSKPKEKRSASMAELDEPSPPPKRARHDEKFPFVFIKNMKLLHEDNILARRMFLDLVEAQDKRAVYGGHNPKEMHKMAPCIDPKDLFDKSDTSLVDTHFGSVLDKTMPDHTVILESEGDSIFGTWYQQLLSKEDGKEQQKGASGSPRKSGDQQTTKHGDILPEDNRADVGEAPAGCDTNGDKGLPTALLPLIEAATEVSPLEAILDHSRSPSQRSSNTSLQFVSIPPPVAQAPSGVVPEASHLPEAKKSGPEGKKKRFRRPKAAQADSSGVVGSGVAGPSTSTTSTTSGSFAYSDAQAKEIWELANLGDYLGAHALFDPSERAILIEGKTNVQKHLEKDPKLKKRLEDSAEGPERECLYLCGASAIWKRIGDPKDAAGQYELTYKRCKGHAYPTVDNYKKHVYRHHLHKYYKPYKKEAGVDEGGKEESVKGKGKAALKQKKAKVSEKEDDGYKGEDYEKDD